MKTKLASPRLSGGLLVNALRAATPPSSSCSSSRGSLSRLFILRGLSRLAAGCARVSFCTTTRSLKARPGSFHPSKTKRPPLNPDAVVFPAPKLDSNKSGTNRYIVYDPSSPKFGGLEHLPSPSPGNKPMKFFYQILTTPTADTPGTTLLLNFPEKRYFFGQISEGTQRACTERGVRLSYLTDIFLTGRTEWANNGGLIGAVLTQADAISNAAAAIADSEREREARRRANETPEQTAERLRGQESEMKHGAPYALRDGELVMQRGHLTIHGGRNLTHTLATARRFVFRKGMPVYVKEYDSENLSRPQAAQTPDPFEQPTFTDNNIKVWAMAIGPSGTPNNSPKSPRKRSLDEFQEREGAERSLDQRTKDQLMRQSVVSDMFNSSWRMDSLIEMPLATVKMPATIFVRNPETKDLEQYKGPMPGDNKPLPDIKVLVRQPWPGAAIEKLPPTTRSEEALCYIVKNHDIRGKFDPKKAQELKVPKGPAYAELTKGQSVQSQDGKTITPDMVLGPPRLGRGTAIIDLPTPDYVENLVNRPEWKSPAITSNLEAFVWILGPGVGEHPRLREFVASWPQCKHIVSGTDYCPNYLALHSVAGSSIRLAKLKGDSYSIPFHDNVTLPQPGTPTAGSKTTIESVQNSPFQPAECGLILDMEPNFGINRAEVVPPFNPSLTVSRIPRSVEQRMKAIRRRVSKPSFQQEVEELQKSIPGADAEIITLGTGSSVPSKYRNVSATLVKVPGHGYYLLDCGENTLGQLKRVFGPEQLKEVLQNLRLIWISHLHADHHLGTASVIKAWYREHYGERPNSTETVETDLAKILREKRLVVVSEEMMIGWLEEYASVENYGFDKLVPLAVYPYHKDGAIKTALKYRHVRGDGTYPGSEAVDARPRTTDMSFEDVNSPLTKLLQERTGLADLLAARVNHCRGAMAVSLVFPDSFKVSYSGDCRPSPNFAAIGRDSTVLIHEATFQDDMSVSAIAKKHSTTAEALEVGRQMQARTILLTHFSQRYQKVASAEQRTGTVKTEDPAAIAAAEPRPVDIPVDEAEPGEIKVSGNQPREDRKAPVAVSFDYMRIRVGDIPVAQAYAPALEKLFDILERAAAQESSRMREEQQQQQTENKNKKNKQNKQKGKNAKQQAPAASPEAMDVDAKAQQAGKRRVSVWSASESEAGWSVSESEGESGKRKSSPRRSRSGSDTRMKGSS
ncbi:tRNA processing endoribonuclease Trz1 [Paecilomyces variotii No. 5]|uniref:ribonuclease Z n=1 Tax=Byssochlamys spectabilis (strain No. 5 / NBRC 109023) TaxID=1356009 RepID=V5GE19_BYSSN|nr:tRNA processing endoribonuclease Trz1 [Paecilomyces variotii No. 5]